MDMDFRGPVRNYPQQPAYREAPPQQQPQQRPPEYQDAPPQHHGRKGGKGKGFLKFLLVLILIAAAGAGAWYYRDKQAKDDAKSQAAQISDLQDQLTTARDSLAAANAKTQTDTTQTGPSEDTLKKIETAISTKKYSDIQDLMAPNISKFVYATDGDESGLRTPAKMVSELKYLDNAKAPWDFDLPEKTISGYQDSNSPEYFTAGALIGKSSNNYLVSFVFNNDGKIVGVFLSVSDKLD
jgi:predicted negative regulator of RcsB-dependent stress response